MKKIIINEQFNRMRKIAGLITENESNESSDLEVKWAPEYYKNTKEYGGDAYHEMGLVTAPYAMVGDKKVKEIVGYFYDEDDDEDEEIIGYIFSKSGKDIESYSEDDLDDAFMKAVDIENNRLSESKTTKNQTAETLYQMFKDKDLLNDRREYDAEDFMSSYPNLSQEEAEKLEKMLQNPSMLNEESHSPVKMFELIKMYISNYHDGGMGAGAALNKIEDILDGKLDGYDIAFLKGEEDLYENKTQLNEDKPTVFKMKNLIYHKYREIVDSGKVEKGTEEWLFLLQLALKVYGLDIKNEYDILKGIEGKGPYAKQIKALKDKGDIWLQDLEIALDDLEVESY